MAPPTTPAAMPQPYLPAFAALVGKVRLAASVTTARLAAIVDLKFMTGSLEDFWWTGMVLMPIGRAGQGKVQTWVAAGCGLCGKSQRCIRALLQRAVWPGNRRKTPKGREARPFATHSA